MANDTADSSAVLAITSQPVDGAASIVNGQIRYVPAQNYDGTVTIGYSLTDRLGQSASTTLTIQVTAAFAARDDGSVANPILAYPAGVSVSPLLNDSGLNPALTSILNPPTARRQSIMRRWSIQQTMSNLVTIHLPIQSPIATIRPPRQPYM